MPATEDPKRMKMFARGYHLRQGGRRLILGGGNLADSVIELSGPVREGTKKRKARLRSGVYTKLDFHAPTDEPEGEPLAPSTEPPHDSSMNEHTDQPVQRVSQLADNVSELAQSVRQQGEHIAALQGTIKGAGWGLGLFVALLAAFLGYMGLQLGEVRDEMRSTAARADARMDRLEDKVDALPAELRGIADSITSAITATQSGQPPVIIIERPGPEPQPLEE